MSFLMQNRSKMSEKKSKFLVAGMVTSVEFQRSRFYIERLYKSRPNVYEKPDIRPFLNVSWCQYLTKIRRKIGGKIWSLKKHCVVFLDGNYIGDDDDLFKYVLGLGRLRIAVDFYVLGVKQLKDILKKDTLDGQKFAYFTIAIDGINVGSMLFALYEELVPLTTTLFLKRCKSKKHGWNNTKIHRIVKDCWIQGGGLNLKHKHIPCENYIIPHNRRGVLSMCNGGIHTDNSVQYIISLNPTPWMDYKYVAFGQLVQGEEVLRKIEAVHTKYEAPKNDVSVILCGEYFADEDSDPKDVAMISKYYENVDEKTGLPVDVIAPFDVESGISVSRYRKGDYCLDSDLKSNAEFMQLPSFIVRMYMEYTGVNFGSADEEGTEDDVEKEFKLRPIIESLTYHSSVRKLKAPTDEDHIDETEVIQKVVEFDSAPPLHHPVRPTSSELLHNEDAKTMFV